VNCQQTSDEYEGGNGGKEPQCSLRMRECAPSRTSRSSSGSCPEILLGSGGDNKRGRPASRPVIPEKGKQEKEMRKKRDGERSCIPEGKGTILRTGEIPDSDLYKGAF